MGNSLRDSFELKRDVHANIAELRRHLGSVQRELSLEGLAQLLNERDGGQRNASTIQRWERTTEPDLASIKLMADLAGVAFEEFALGAKRRAKLEKPDVPAPRPSEQRTAEKRRKPA
jgi:transcriptional regulator with XRE-family HTH domain